MKKHYLYFAIFIYLVAVVYLALTTPISPLEARTFYQENDITSLLMHWGDRFVGGFIGLRIFFLFAGVITLFIFYQVNIDYFEKKEDAYLSTFIFMFLPGILTASTLVNIAILVLPFVLLFILMYMRKQFWILPFLMLGLFLLHDASIIFFIAVALYAFNKKEQKIAILATVFLILFIFFSRGIAIGGGPSGHFLEIFGLYATLFSPLLFLYFFYALYRILLRGQKSLIWYISFSALIVSLLLSIRQRVEITDFAPYVMIALPLMVEQFYQSLRIRLPQFQIFYKRAFYVTFFLLGVSASMVIFHQATYLLSKHSHKHFAKRIYEPYFLAQKLRKQKIKCYKNIHGIQRYQLRYYGILSCDTH